MLSGCTPNGIRQELTGIDPGLPDRIELAATPFNPQTMHQCGPAALATVLQSHGVDITPAALASRIYLPEREGSLQVEITAAARSYGMLPYPLQADFSDLLAEIAAGNPVLVMQNLGLDWWPQWHYAVVIGYDRSTETLILRSGTSRRRYTDFATFLNTWGRADRWALVIVPVGALPATVQIDAYLQSIYALEETGLPAYASTAYRAATARWPDQAVTWLMSGNMAYASGATEEAVSSLLQASRLAPADASIWNNLAYALQAYGCSEQAFEALECAYRYSPGDDNIRDSEAEIRRMENVIATDACPPVRCE